MLAAGGLFNALLALAAIVAFGTAFGAAMIWTALKLTDGGKVKASAESFRAGGAKLGADLRDAHKTIQAKQTKSTHFKPRITSGQAAK